MKKGIIVGAGIAGIAAAIRMAKKGYAVEVFEANAYPGGKLSAFSLGEYRFDAGPSLFTMPHFVDELFHLCGENPKEHFNYKKKDIACNYFWEDGTTLTAYGDKEQFLDEVEKKLGVPSASVKKYLDRAKRKYDLTENLFLRQSLHRLKTYLSFDTLKAIFQINTMEINRSLNQINEAQLQSPHLVQYFNRYATYNGSSPYQTPGIMTLVQHLESHYGTFVPKGGMVQISQSLFELAKRQGVRFHFNQKVEQILVEKKKAKGVIVHGKPHFSDWVISNMDIFPTYKKLLPKHKMPFNVKREERSSSAIIFYWGMVQKFPSLDLHNIFFSDDYQSEFKAIFQEHSLSDDPTVYVNITSKDVPEDAPSYGENWFVMVNTPADYGQDWAALTEQLKQRVIKKLNRILDVDLSSLIEEEEIMTPPQIQMKTQSHLGALYGASSNNKMAAFLRHPNFKTSISNLFFCGGSVHPGGGIPLCLLSAKIATGQIS